jgi:hypothetical protein
MPDCVAELPAMKAHLAAHAIDPAEPLKPAAAKRGVGSGSLADDLDLEEESNTCCNTTKDKGCKNATSAGLLAVGWSCGIVIHLQELYGSESLSQLYAHLLGLWMIIYYVPPYFFYDDGCHLARYLLNPVRFWVENTTIWQRTFSTTRVFIDRMHFPNHVDAWCKAHMDPKDVTAATGANTQVCGLKSNLITESRTGGTTLLITGIFSNRRFCKNLRCRAYGILFAIAYL